MTGVRTQTAVGSIASPAFRAPDAVTFLTVYLVLLWAIPSNRSIPSLGSAGTVALLWGLVALVLWCYFLLLRANPELFRRPNPVRAAELVFIGAALASYIAAMTRAIPGDEINPADTGLIRLAGWAGILFIAADGITSFARLLTLARRIVFGGTLLAALGTVQFFTGQSFVDLLVIPGLTTGDGYLSVDIRGGLVRSAGTATHPLEYGLVLSMILPVALTLAMREKNRWFVVRWLPVGLIVLGLVLSGSRSSIIGLLVGVAVLAPTWTRGQRLTLAAGAVAFVGVTYVIAPRVINNFRYLFIATGTDSSSSSRASSLGFAVDFFERAPFFGRGFGTFQPQYQILDNQLLLLAVEIGLVGVLAFLAVCVTAVVCSITAARGLSARHDPLVRGLGFALGGSVLAGTVLLALFDGLSFPQAAGTVFLFLGLSGAYWRLARAESRAEAGAEAGTGAGALPPAPARAS
ncbi:O-antigen ligase family protein [Conyzicola sp.]|uniref:O-antigen ligase family protein n=1 Tax=Conyzicola sp. TaxID=1969404 RepID=UPI0039890163